MGHGIVAVFSEREDKPRLSHLTGTVDDERLATGAVATRGVLPWRCDTFPTSFLAKTDFGIDHILAETDFGINHLMAETEVGIRQR